MAKFALFCIAFLIAVGAAVQALKVQIKESDNLNSRDGSDSYGAELSSSAGEEAGHSEEYHAEGATQRRPRPPPVSTACNDLPGDTLVAKCTFTTPHNSAVEGTLTLKQRDADTLVKVTGTLTNIDPEGKHGFHVHEGGDFSKGCESAGEHYNPYNAPHGAPNDPPHRHHEGDMGNIRADATGTSNVNFEMNKILTMYGKDSIIGRSIVVHAMHDDLGRGHANDSLISGHSGARIGCCVIGYKAVQPPPPKQKEEEEEEKYQ